jgi:hypothetical protein
MMRMKKFLALLFSASFVVGWFALGPNPPHIRVGEAVGWALVPTFLGWLVARNVGWQWSAASVAALLAVMWIGR